MEVTEQTVDSGQGQETPAASGNAGRTDALTDAITAAVKASREKSETPSPTKDEAGVDKTAGDKRGSEDAGEFDPTAKQAEPAKEGTEPPKKGEEEPKTFEAPQHWPEADRKAFAALQPEAQSIIRRLARDLEGGFTRKSQELTDKARYAETVRGLIDEGTRQQLAASGANEVQYFAHLHKLQSFAANDPPGFAKWFMQSNGLTPEHLGLPTASKPDTQPAANTELEALLSDPKVKQLETELAQIKGHLTERQQAELRAQHMHRIQAEQRLLGMAQEFRSTLDDAGQARFPHFDTVRTEMGALMETNPELARMPDGPEKMAKAYDMAVWARPDLRASFLEQEATRRVAAAEKAREAARAKQITAVKPSAGVVAQSAKPKSLDDIIRDQMGQRGLSY